MIVCYKTMIRSLQADVAAQRIQLAQLAQSTRQQHQVHREKQQNMIESVASVRKELTRKTEALDGLCASIYDACELYVECDPVEEEEEKEKEEEEDDDVAIDG